MRQILQNLKDRSTLILNVPGAAGEESAGRGAGTQEIRGNL